SALIALTRYSQRPKELPVCVRRITLNIMEFRSRELAWLMAVFLSASLLAAEIARAGPSQQPLQLTISLDQSTVYQPFAARVTLHFHNSSQGVLWLYRPTRDAGAMFMGEVNANSNGSLIATHLQLTAAQNASGVLGSVVPGVGTVLRSPDFPHPGLISIPAGGDVSEEVAIELEPASVRTAGGKRPLWGYYELSVVYNATFADAQALRSDAKVDLWVGSLNSHAVPLRLEPAPDSSRGVISGSVVDRETRPAADVLVSISDWNEHLITQEVTAADGEFYASALPFGRYWVTVRRAGADHDTSFFEHADVTASQPEARLHLVMLHEDVYEGKKMLHKPVFFRITDSAGNPVPDAELEILWDDGTVLSNVKAKANDEGLAAVNLIPGNNYVTTSKHGCEKKDSVANVPDGDGVTVFPLTIDCKGN
ncbi:MAG: carboxypeptidase regulatory-like domain-containing protein, partial [Terriglobia bacterium]